MSTFHWGEDLWLLSPPVKALRWCRSNFGAYYWNVQRSLIFPVSLYPSHKIIKIIKVGEAPFYRRVILKWMVYPKSVANHWFILKWMVYYQKWMLYNPQNGWFITKNGWFGAPPYLSTRSLRGQPFRQWWRLIRQRRRLIRQRWGIWARVTRWMAETL